jgi:Gpi18-like mannosyltransferase
VNRASGLFLAGLAAALIAGHLLRDTPGFVVRTADGGYEGDITHYVYWTRLVTLGGIQAAYSGQWPETYAVYPPVTLYAYQVIGNLYRVFQDAAFDPELAQASLWLREAIKFVALTWHLLTALAIYALVRWRWGATAAGLAGVLYVANPAALYDVAHWGQPDGAHSLFSVLAVGLLGLGQVGAAWDTMALAALSKPQAWAILPLLAIATWRDHGSRALGGGIAVAALVGGVVVLPFVVTGHLGELLTLPGTVGSVMPVVSADAHNLWWLVAAARGLDPLTTPDAARLIGPLTFRLAAVVLVLGQFGLSYWLFWTRRASLAEAAALGALGWFVFTTQAHENHLFFALPLLALAWPGRRALLGVVGLLSVTLLLNMVLHDQLVLEGLGRDLNESLIANLRLANAAANVLCFVGWSLVRITGQHETHRPTPDDQQESRAHPPGRRAQLQHTP